MAQPPEGALDQSGQLLCSAVVRLLYGCSLVRDRAGLAAFEAGLQHATLVMLAAFGAVLIAQVHLHAPDVHATLAQGTLHDATDLSSQRLVTCDIKVCINIGLYVIILLSW